MIIGFIVAIVVLFIMIIYLYREAYATRIYRFHRPGCSACEAMTKEWTLFKSSTYGMIKVIDVDTSKAENELISNDFGVDTVPTIVKVNDDMRTAYTGERTSAAISEWANKE
jgi:hypothetical protein